QELERRPTKRTLRSGEVSAGILEKGDRRSRLLGVSFSLSTAFYPNPASRLTAAWRSGGEKGRAIYIYIYT
ncbi:unnamed protein product, partial [Ectocarpus sp. 4 AP-2014]